MITGMLIGVVATVASVLGWKALRTASATTRNVAIAVFLGLWVVGVIVKVQLDRAPDVLEDPVSVARSMQRIGWTEGVSSESRSAPPSTVAEGGITAAAPVPELLSGLEARLAAEPNDANGWALLAQSYAFIGNLEKAEESLARAVALGVDEQTLRERVDLAKRDAHPAGSWIERTLGD